MSDFRINKYISDNSNYSRRQADKLIENGRVSINGRLAVNGDKVSDKDSILVDGNLLKRKVKNRIYIALNKPKGIVCTTDTRVRNNISDYMGFDSRIFTIGRLDKDSEGLILLTNDGDIVNPILRAEFAHEKEYIVRTKREFDDNFLEKMSKGVKILSTKTKPCRVWRIKERTFGIILTQGLNRQIRRMCEALGHEVSYLQRIRIMNISLGNLRVGEYRELGKKELIQLKSLLYTLKDSENLQNANKDIDKTNNRSKEDRENISSLGSEEKERLRAEAVRSGKAILGPYLSFAQEEDDL